MKTSLFFALLISAYATTGYAGNTKISTHTHKPIEVSLANSYDTYTISTTEETGFIEVSGETVLGDKLKDGTMLKTAKPSVNELKSTDRWQKWLISKQTNGYFTIMNLNSGKYITASAGKSITQARANQTDAQYWRITKAQGNYYKITNKGNNLAISNSLSNDSALTQSAYINSAAQHWKLNAIKADSYRDDAVVGFFQRNSGSSAFDEGSSIPLYYSLNKGKVLWVTGDTFYNQVDAKGEFGCNLYFPYHNSALLQPADHSWGPEKTKNLISSDGPQIFRPANPKNLFWPGAGIEVGNKIYVHNIEVIAGTLNTVNQYLGVITETSTYNIPPVEVVPVPGMTGQTAIVYTVGMVNNPKDGCIYAYGIGGYMAASVFVARFAPAAPTKWKFWDGKNWADKPSVAASAAVAKASTNNIAVGYVNGKFLLISMDFGFTCDVTTRNMYSSVSNSPTGPFINKKTIYTLPDYKQGHAPVYYNPTIHAEFKNGHNELLIAYCINFYNRNDAKNTTCLTPCSNPDGSEDPNDYRIKGIRVPFSLMGL